MPNKKNDQIPIVRPSLPPLHEYADELKDIWNSGFLTNSGPKSQTLEKELCRCLDVAHTSLFCNGHMALEAALSVLSLSGEVITTPFTFASTTQAIVRTGLRPVFCDIDPKNYTIDPQKIEALITENTSAILPVHVYGNICDWRALENIAEKHGVALIYDAAHAFGVTTDGRSAAALGHISMFSFHSTKVFHTVEGGALCYNDPAFTERFSAWRNFGLTGNNAEIVGANAKMSEFHAAMGLCNLRHIKQDIQKRKALCMRYRERLSHIPGLRLCPEQKGVTSNYAYFPVLFDPEISSTSRDEAAAAMECQGILPRKYFWPLTSAFDAYANYNYSGETPIAEQVAEQILSLPLYATLEIEQIDRICDIIQKL